MHVGRWWLEEERFRERRGGGGSGARHGGSPGVVTAASAETTAEADPQVADMKELWLLLLLLLLQRAPRLPAPAEGMRPERSKVSQAMEMTNPEVLSDGNVRASPGS